MTEPSGRVLKPIRQMSGEEFAELRKMMKSPNSTIRTRAALAIHKARIAGQLASHLGAEPARTVDGKPLDGGGVQ